MFDTKPFESRMQQAFAHFEDELKKIRTGRAHSSMLDGVMVEAYGTRMPINQVGNVVAVEAQLLQVTPFDPTTIKNIVAAIRDDQALGLNPSDDGRVVRVPIPPLTTERRQQIAKQLGEKVEECRIALRNVRHDALRDAKAKKDAKELSEDDLKRIEKGLDSSMADFQAKLDAATKAKETEIMTV
jgi:ribosome recycling factor